MCSVTTNTPPVRPPYSRPTNLTLSRGFLFSGNGFRVPTINAGTLVNPLVNRRCCRPVARADGREGPRCSPVVALEVGRAEEAWRAAQEVSRTCRSAFGAKRALSSLGFAGFLARHGVLPHANCLARASSAAHAHATLPSPLADFCVPPLLRTQLCAQLRRRSDAGVRHAGAA